MEEFVGPPYTYTVNITDEPALRKLLQEIKSMKVIQFFSKTIANLLANSFEYLQMKFILHPNKHLASSTQNHQRIYEWRNVREDSYFDRPHGMYMSFYVCCDQQSKTIYLKQSRCFYVCFLLVDNKTLLCLAMVEVTEVDPGAVGGRAPSNFNCSCSIDSMNIFLSTILNQVFYRWAFSKKKTWIGSWMIL